MESTFHDMALQKLRWSSGAIDRVFHDLVEQFRGGLVRFEDERYVRLYTRKTVGYKLLPWQSKALLPLIMRELDRAGILNLDSVDPVEAVAALTDMPIEFVGPGLSGLMRAEVINVSPAALVMPKFMDAQEIPISDAQRKREQRERDRLKSLESNNCHAMSRDVTTGHESHVSVTPNRAVPSVPSVPSELEKACAKKPRNAPDPRFIPLKEKLVAEYKKTTGDEYGFDGGRDAKAIKALIPKGSDEEILQRWRRGLTAPPGWLRTSNIHDLDRKWNDLRPGASKPGDDVRKGVAEVDASAWANGGDGGYGKLREDYERKKAGGG